MDAIATEHTQAHLREGDDRVERRKKKETDRRICHG